MRTKREWKSIANSWCLLIIYCESIVNMFFTLQNVEIILSGNLIHGGQVSPSVDADTYMGKP